MKQVGRETPREYDCSLPPWPPPGPSPSPIPPSLPVPIPRSPDPPELVLSAIQGKPTSFCCSTTAGACASKIVVAIGRGRLALSGSLGGANCTDDLGGQNH